MGRWHNHYMDGMVHFCTATVDGWQQSLGDAATKVIYHELESSRKSLGVKVLAYVIMPEHIHVLLWSDSGEDICKFMQRVLSRTSKRIGQGGKLWKERSRAVCVYSAEVLRTKLDYIHANPLKRGLVSLPEDWPHSSYNQVVLGCQGSEFRCDPWPEGIYLS
jgi:REP element-mobilizing transposase RayT